MGELGAQALWHVTVRWILHVDLDQFQAAVEVRRNPELAGLPIIVGGNGDPMEPRKVVTCASYPAREFGVHAGMPLRTAARKCPDAIFLPLDTDAYDEASEEVMGLLRDLGHPVEVWGWDEAYVGADVEDAIGLAEQIREAVAAGTGLSCSVGISDNKQRAKVATGFGKPSRSGSMRLIYAHRVQLDDCDGRPRGRRSVGRRTEDSQKACRTGHYHRRRPRRHRRHAADVDVRTDDRAVDPAVGQGRRRHDSQRPTVGAAIPQSRHHLPA